VPFFKCSLQREAMCSILLASALACSDDASSDPIRGEPGDGMEESVETGSERPSTSNGASTGNGSRPSSGSGGSSTQSSGSGGTSSTPTTGAGATSSNPGTGSTPGTGGTDSTTPTVTPADGAPTAESASRPGSFQVLTLSDELRDGPDYGSQTLHIPQGAPGPLAGVAIIPGLGEDESSIAAWGPFLASHGIVALTIGTNDTGDSVEERASALLDALETIKAEDERAGSPLEGKLALDRMAVMGWSMGGGATLLASSRTPSLKAAVTLAAWNDGASFEDEQVPTLLLAGSADEDAGGQSQDFFESIPASTPKLLFEVQGGTHTIANNPSAASGVVGRFGLAWLKVFLEGDERYRALLLEEPSAASDFRENLSAR
jgi:dienelactone hydrolase